MNATLSPSAIPALPLTPTPPPSPLRSLLFHPLVLLLSLSPLAAAAPTTPAGKLDAYLDNRWDPPASATSDLLKDLNLDAPALEKLLRAGRESYPEPPQARGKVTGGMPLVCEHVDHQTRYLIFVPTSYDPKKATPLVLVAHGGSAERDLNFGERAAIGGTNPFWFDAAQKHGYIVVLPLTDRGWGSIGNSIALSLLSKVQREYHIDPDRIYVTGHSMGGHMTWRSAITMADRWAAVSPMSGGYDYVKDKQVFTMFNVPGYATWGTQEPYGINGFNHTIKAFMDEHGYDWVMREKQGGHEIFPDEIEPICEFFDKHPRDLYRRKVYARGSGSMTFHTAEPKKPGWAKASTWDEKRPIPVSTFHWVRLLPLPKDTPAESATQSVLAVNNGDNTITITAENAKKLKIYLHPKMVDFSKPVTITINGKESYKSTLTPDPKTLLELAREFDDRGRVYYACIELNVTESQISPEPHK